MAELDKTPADFDWQPAWSVHSQPLDCDHQGFFSLARLLYEAEADGLHEMVVESAISLLQEYVQGHFRREEQAMRTAQYPDLDAHIKLHDAFKAQVGTLIQAVQDHQPGAVRQLACLTRDWVSQHILQVDMHYTPWVKDADVDQGPLGTFLSDADADATDPMGLLDR